MRRKVRLTESDLHRMIKESVVKAINEVGDTPAGQRKLGALQSRKFMKSGHKESDKVYDYAKKARGGDEYDNRGSNKNPMYKDYANGYLDYMNSHPDEYFDCKRRQQNESLVRKVVRESIKRVLKEGTIPQYEEPVFIECTSPEDADMSVEIGYSSYSSSLFYVGECGTDGYAALAAVVQWLEENGLIDHYAYSEEDLVGYHPDDIIEVEGYYFPSWQIHINQLCDNHGGRRF